MSLQELFSKEQLQEMSLIEIAHDYLQNSKQPISFNDLMSEIAAALGLTDEQVKARIAQFYTDLNIDGRFMALGENRWGLRVWYPVDTTEEDVVTHAKPKKKKAKKVVEEAVELDDYDEDFDDYDDEDLDDFDDEEEDDLLDDEESFDDIDEVDEDLDDVDDEFDDDVIDEDEGFDLDEEELDEDLDEEEEEKDEDKEL